MRKENKERLQRLQDFLERIVEDEITQEVAENKQMRLEIAELKRELQSEKEQNKKHTKTIDGLVNFRDDAQKLIGELEKDGVIKYCQNGDGGYDEYGNGRGYHEQRYEYKDQQYLYTSS